MKKWMLILLSGVYLCGFVTAQSDHISFRNISINEGLSQSSVVDIAPDHAGFMWFATQDGLNRYDGKEFLIFKKNFDDFTTAAGSTTGKIAIGRGNDLWMITSGGKLERMNLYDQTILKVPSLSGIQLPAVSCIYPEGDHIWIGTENRGLFIYNLNTRHLVHHTTESSSLNRITNNQIQEIFADRQGRKWVLTANGVYVFTDIHTPCQVRLSYSVSDSKAGYASELRTPDSRLISSCSIAEDSKGSLWLGTYGKGLWVKKRNDSLFHPFDGYATQAFPRSLTIFSVLADQLNRIWVGTYGQGLFVINPADSSIKHILSDRKNPFSLGYNDVLSIRQDKKGGVWIGTDGGGVSYYDRRLNNFTLYSSNNVPENVSIEQIRSITTDKTGVIWLGTSNNGLTFIDPSKSIAETIHFPPYKQDVSNYERIVSLLTDEEGDIWVGTQGNGLLIIDPKTKKIKKRFHPDTIPPFSIPGHTVWCMHPGDNKNVWIATRYAGLTLVNKNSGVLKNYLHYSAIKNSVEENNIRKIVPLNDSMLCIGLEKKGIQFFNTRQGRFVNVPALEKVWQTETAIKTLYFRYPILWIGTAGRGIIAYNLNSEVVSFITEEHGLPNHTVYAILPDNSNSLWISTNKGICRFSPPTELALANRSHFTLFSVEDGLQSNEFNTGAFHRSDDGRLFFGGIKGLNILNPEKIVTTSEPIKTVIIRATINNQAYKGDTNILHKKTLRLPHSANSLAFDFAALDFVSANKLTYYYQLDDYEKDWINAGNRSYASYTNLPPGNYVFKVKASNNLASSIDPVTTLNIIIEPPFWQRWWFIGLTCIALFGILYFLYRYRINQLIALQKVRNRIATDLHDDIGSTLTNISILSELSRKNMQDHEQTKNFLNRISEEVYFSNQALDDIVWSINTSNDTLEQTVARMRRYAAEVFDGANISYSLQLDEKFEHYKLSMDQRRDCFLLFKEAINNIYKHAEAKKVSIKLWVERNHLYMEIHDDGKGFNTSMNTNRNGIKNMHSRMQKWKGSVKIKSGEGKGTSTELKFPL